MRNPLPETTQPIGNRSPPTAHGVTPGSLHTGLAAGWIPVGISTRDQSWGAAALPQPCSLHSGQISWCGQGRGHDKPSIAWVASSSPGADTMPVVCTRAALAGEFCHKRQRDPQKAALFPSSASGKGTGRASAGCSSARPTTQLPGLGMLAEGDWLCHSRAQGLCVDQGSAPHTPITPQGYPRSCPCHWWLPGSPQRGSAQTGHC